MFSPGPTPGPFGAPGGLSQQALALAQLRLGQGGGFPGQGGPVGGFPGPMPFPGQGGPFAGDASGLPVPAPAPVGGSPFPGQGQHLGWMNPHNPHSPGYAGPAHLGGEDELHQTLANASPRVQLETLARARAVAQTMQHLRRLRPSHVRGGE